MVAPKKGRGAKNQAVKAKANQPEEVADNDIAENVEENNGEAQPESEQAEQAAGADEEHEEQAEGAENQEGDEEVKGEETKEEKVETGKILVENLPPSYLFDYQDKLKELFSKHGEIISVK